MQHLLTFDISQRYSSKPTNAGLVSRNLITQKHVTIEQFATLVTQPYGHSFCPATFKGTRKNDNWAQQSLFCLDFDSGLTPEEGLKYFTDLGIRPNVIYTSFSDTPSLRKTRFCFFINKQVTDPKEFKFIQLNLMRIADAQTTSSDPACKDFARLFYPGKDVVHLDTAENDFDTLVNILNTVQIAADSNKTRGILDTPNSVSKRVSLYNIYSNTRPETENGTDTSESMVANWYTEKFDFDKAKQEVRIFADFMNGVWLTHPQLFGLASNMRWIKGGLKLMKDTMIKYNNERKTFYTANNFAIITYISSKEYIPSNLSTFSPYKEDADYTNLITSIKGKRGIIERTTVQTKISVDEASDKLKTEFKRVLEASTNKIYIFKVATGLGKTQLLTETRYNAVLAFPTHSLKDEVATRMKLDNGDWTTIIKPFMVVPSLPKTGNQAIDNQLNFLIESGVKGVANNFIKSLINDTATVNKVQVNIDDAKKAEFRQYLDAVTYSYTTTENVLTTHQRLVKSDYDIHNTYIFDECPLNALYTINDVTLNDIANIVQNPNIDNTIKAAFSSMKTWYEGLLFNVVYPKLQMVVDMNLVNQAVLDGHISTNVRKFLAATHIVKHDSNNMSNASFITANTLPSDKKIIILSATAPVELYKLIYADRVEVIEIDNIEQAGKQVQYTKYSYSRTSLNKHQEIADRVDTLPVITFASFKSLFKNPVNDIHFGNCSGYDNLKGTDIAVVGTPYHPHYVILLWASAIGIDFKTEETECEFDTIEYNGFKFKFNAYTKKELRMIQLSLIEAELVQAVGRNRILRENCTTHLFSNFPLKNTTTFIAD